MRCKQRKGFLYDGEGTPLADNSGKRLSINSLKKQQMQMQEP